MNVAKKEGGVWTIELWMELLIVCYCMGCNNYFIVVLECSRLPAWPVGFDAQFLSWVIGCVSCILVSTLSLELIVTELVVKTAPAQAVHDIINERIFLYSQCNVSKTDSALLVLEGMNGMHLLPTTDSWETLVCHQIFLLPSILHCTRDILFYTIWILGQTANKFTLQA